MTTRLIDLLFIGMMLLLAAGAGSAAWAEDDLPQTTPFGKEPGSIYLGGTAGLSGIDSIRGFTDSLFYLKWYDRPVPEATIAPEKVIYGDDDRVDVYTVTDPDLLKLAQATCVIVFASEFSNNGNGTYDLAPAAWTYQGGLPLCDGERFVGQLQIGNCSGFLVGDDIVVTAGHCLSACGTWGFLFGYQQTDSLTPPVLTVPEDDLYFCSEILGWAYSGDDDYCVVRLDRPVVGREPIPVRREGLVADGSPLVVVGHPTVLPMKIAGGAEVKDNRDADPWFQANTDTYGGNSGSMVVNTDTWLIEGILVRGAPDFVYTSCAASNVVPNSGNPGTGLEFEEITKITEIEHLIPLLVNSAGTLDFDKSLLSCADQLAIELADLDLASLGSYALLVYTSAADSELVSLTETFAGSAVFGGTVATDAGPVAKYDGILQVSDGEVVTGRYEDDDDGSGSPAVAVASGSIDCVPPSIGGVAVVATGATWVTVSFTTGEIARGRVSVGAACGVYPQSGVGETTLSHQITVGSLMPSTPYVFMVEAYDLAENQTRDDNGGACYAFSTTEAEDVFTEVFTAGCDLSGKTLMFQPTGAAEFYEACLSEAAAFPVSTDGATTLALTDDSFAAVALDAGAQVLFFGGAFSTVYVGSNGYVTFVEGDADWSETIEEHLAFPPRISAFWDDLDPLQGGEVTYRQLSDRLVVTWDAVPEHSTALRVSVQLQLYFDGVISLTYLDVQPLDGIVGLSAGTGPPADLVLSDLSGYGACEQLVCYVDADGDTFGDENDPGDLQAGLECGAGSSPNNLDCADGDENVYPGAPEILDDAVDQDCDGVDPSCCQGKVGDVNGLGGDVPTIGDISVLIDHLYITGTVLGCIQEADVNQSGGRYPIPDDITIGDISVLIDHLFISGVALNDCL